MRAFISRGILAVGLSFPKWRRAVATTALLVLGVSALAGCSGASSASTIAPITITDFRSVAGRWSGPLTAEGRPRRDDDWVDLTIGQDGAYAFAPAEFTGPFVGKGQFVIKDGKLMMDGARGPAAFTLLQRGAGRVLRGDAVQASGPPVWAELSPAQ